jgi:hypothetical protein
MAGLGKADEAAIVEALDESTLGDSENRENAHASAACSGCAKTPSEAGGSVAGTSEATTFSLVVAARANRSEDKSTGGEGRGKSAGVLKRKKPGSAPAMGALARAFAVAGSATFKGEAKAKAKAKTSPKAKSGPKAKGARISGQSPDAAAESAAAAAGA